MDSRDRTNRRRFLTRASACGMASVAALAGCQENKGFTFLGYDFGASHLYDSSIRTVYVPVFHNRAFQTTPYRGMEVEITKAVVRELNSKTPFRVVSDPEKADTELLGYLVTIDKAILNRDQQNEVREANVVLAVDVVWRDLRTGRLLSSPRKPASQVPPPGTPGSDVPQFDPNLPVPPEATVVDGPIPVRIVATGRMLQELGETNATAAQKAVNVIATQIVSMMEKPW